MAKKNPESIALADSEVEFIAPASFYKNNKSPRPTSKDGSSEQVITEKVNPQTIHSDGTSTDETSIENASVSNQQSGQSINLEINEVANEIENEIEVVEPISVAEPISKIALPKIDVKIKSDVDKGMAVRLAEKRISGLSISSLKAKKTHELNKKDKSVDPAKLPRESFTEEEMQKHWADFVKKLDEDGRKILASNLHTDVPKLQDDSVIWIEMPNSTMKKEIEREQFDLMEHLRQKLNNHLIELRITVNEETAKKFAFTPEEKYQKLREKNPAIDILRKEFDLDL